MPNLNTADDIKLGSLSPSALYLGTTLVWPTGVTEVVLIEETFNGTGSINNSVADVTSNGNTWDSSNSNPWYQRNSGDLVAQGGSGTSRTVIDVGQTGDFTVTAHSVGDDDTSNKLAHGLVIYDDGVGGASGKFERLSFANSNALYWQRWDGSAYVRNEALTSTSTITAQDFEWVFKFVGKNRLYWSVTGSAGYDESGLLISDKQFNGIVGMFLRQSTTTDGSYWEDFKVTDGTDITETILDEYTVTGQAWQSGNSWWNGLSGGTWSSTGTNVGTYLALDSGSRIETSKIVFSASDPSNPANGGPAIPAGARVRILFTPSTGPDNMAVEGSPTGAGDSRWYWNNGNATTTYTSNQIENGGNFGWDTTDTVTIQLYIP